MGNRRGFVKITRRWPSKDAQAEDGILRIRRRPRSRRPFGYKLSSMGSWIMLLRLIVAEMLLKGCGSGGSEMRRASPAADLIQKYLE